MPISPFQRSFPFFSLFTFPFTFSLYRIHRMHPLHVHMVIFSHFSPTAGGKSQLKTNEAAKNIKCKVCVHALSAFTQLTRITSHTLDLPANVPLHREPRRLEAALRQQASQAQIRGLLRHPRTEPVTARKRAERAILAPLSRVAHTRHVNKKGSGCALY